MTTIHDVARLAAVSIATVSRVINGQLTVNAAIRQRVVDAVAQLAYHPNAIARSLKRERTHLVGVLMPHIANPFFMDVAKGIEDVIGPKLYGLTIASSDWNVDRELHRVRIFAQQRVDAIVLMTVGGTDPRLSELLNSLELPLVLVDRAIPGLKFDTVLPDNVNGIRVLTDHLIKLGHRRIGLITGLHGITSGGERLQGYRLALEEAGLPFDPELVGQVDKLTPETGNRLTAGLIRAGRITALVAGNNNLSIGALLACRELGVQVPSDLSLVGFGDFDAAMLVNPPLTVATNSGYDMGLEAGRILTMRMKEPARQFRPKLIRIASSLIVRSSTAAPFR